MSSRSKGEISIHHWKRRTYIYKLTNILFLLAFLCLLFGCYDSENRWLGDGLNAQEQKQFNCSNRIKDAKVSWRESLQNGPLNCTPGECIEMATEAVVDQNGWFYRAQIQRTRGGDGIDFMAATINKLDHSYESGGGPPPPLGLFFHAEESDDPSLGEDISYADFTYLLSIAPSNDTNKEESIFFAVVAVNSPANAGPFFRLYEMNNDTFPDTTLLTHVATLLTHVESRNIVSIAHDANGNIVVISCKMVVYDIPLTRESTDYRVAKYDPTGVLLWERELQDNTLSAPAIAFDSNNSILIAHDKTGPIDDSVWDLELRKKFLWLSKLDEAGELIWELEMDGVTEFPGLAVDQNDDIILAAAGYLYDIEADRRIRSYRPWIGHISRDGVLQEVFTSEGLFEALSLDSETYMSETLNVQDLVVDRVGRIYIPITARQTMGADRALIAEWTPSLRLCSLVDVQDEAPIRLYLSSDDELFYSNRYSFGKIDR